MDIFLKIAAVILFVIVAWISLAPAPVNYSPGAPMASFTARMAILFVVSSVVFVAFRDYIWVATIWMIGAAIAFEVGQPFLSSRVFGVEDLVGNLAGVFVAFLFYRALWNFAHSVRT